MKCRNHSCEGCDNGEWRVVNEVKDGKRVTTYPLMCFEEFRIEVRQDPNVRLNLRGKVVDKDDCCEKWKPIGE